MRIGTGTLAHVPDADRVVSVIVTVYNGERHLAEAISSVLGQSFDDFELVLVDDGSTDASLEVAQSFRDNRMTVISDGRLGRAGALNRAFEAARGRYVALMDADDVALPTRIERQVQFLDDHPSVGFAGTWYTAVSENGDPLYTKTTLLRDADIRRRFLLGIPIAGPTTIMRREVFDRVGGFREEFVPSEDADFWRRAIFDFEAANIPEVLYLYRVHERSFSNTQGDVQERHRKTIVNDMWQRLEVPNYGLGEVRNVRRFYASQPTPLARDLENEYIAHEAAFCRALFERRRLRNALTLLAALVIEAPSVAPVLGKFVRAARKLRRRKAPVSGQDAIQTGD